MEINTFFALLKKSFPRENVLVQVLTRLLHLIVSCEAALAGARCHAAVTLKTRGGNKVP